MDIGQLLNSVSHEWLIALTIALAVVVGIGISWLVDVKPPSIDPFREDWRNHEWDERRW